MMTLAIVGGVLGAILVLILVVAATKPDSFRVARETVIVASPDRVFPLVNDFHEWPSWSPWEKMDPAMTKTHTGAAHGKGAVYSWKGNSKVGEGRMEITDSVAPSKIRIKLDFLKPFEAHNTAEFSLEAQGGNTKVTWAMTGAQPFMFKVMSVFMNMDRMIGKDFETGLANLKAKAQG